MASELLWRRLSENEKKDIEAKAKNLILEFGKTVEKLPGRKEAFVEREKDRREEGDWADCDGEFKKLMLKNAPKIQGDCIVAEKGKWVK